MIEGVSYSQRDCLDIIEELGVAVSDVRASGGGAKSAFWRRLLAGILNKRVVTLETQEGSAYGAALLALAGEYGSVPEVCRVAIRRRTRCRRRRARRRSTARRTRSIKRCTRR